MNIAVKYFSRGGNTKKLAEAIASALGVEATPVTEPIEGEADVLFLCNSVYWAGADKRVKEFLKANAEKIKKLVNVSSAAIIKSTYKQIKSLAESNGISVDEREFHCKGSFMGMHKGKPDEKDLQAVADFANEIVKG